MKDNLSLKRILLLFYFILFLFYNQNHPSLLLKDQTQHNHVMDSAAGMLKNGPVQKKLGNNTLLPQKRFFCFNWINISSAGCELRWVRHNKGSGGCNAPTPLWGVRPRCNTAPQVFDVIFFHFWFILMNYNVMRPMHCGRWGNDGILLYYRHCIAYS